jgi:hypothetical protein
MIRPITAVTAIEVDNNRSEITRISRFETIDSSDLDREKYLCFATAKRDCHPLLYQRKMMCKRIEGIAQTDHGSYQLLIHRDSETNTMVTLDCKTFGNIEPNPEFEGTIIFTFEEYFTEEEQTELHKIFLSGKYDNLVGVPEF